MTWAEFLKDIADHDQITIVGPLFNRPHQPVMATVYVDGGSDFRQAGGWADRQAEELPFPVVSVGDGDSAVGKLDEVLSADKNFSDLAFVLRSLPPNIATVDLLGFLGERRDHELANLGEIHQFLQTRVQRTTVHVHGSQQNILAFARGTVSIEIKGIFSVMVFEPEAVRISGDCRYKLEGDVVIPVASSLGLSNEANGTVTIKTSKPCFVFLNIN